MYVLLFVVGVIQAILVYLWNPYVKGQIFLHVVYTVATGAVIFLLGRARQPVQCPEWAPWAVLASTFFVTVVLAQVAMHAFPNSSDEYGYNYIADTFLHGRLWNQPLPEPLRDVLETFYIGDRDGKRVSQYPPGWPAVLTAFKLAGAPQFANAIVGLIAAVFLLLALRCLHVPRGVRLGAFVLGVTAPFTLFNNASFFNHSLTAAALLAITWLDLRDTEQPSPWKRASIGLAFSVLLTTRYEAFLIPFALFVLDGLLRRRTQFILWGLPAVAGGASVTALFLLYNWRITGSPFTTTLTWVSPNIGYGLYAVGIEGQHSPLRGLEHTGEWLGRWQDFASVVLIPLYAVALWCRVAARTVRWFDLLLPALVVFFFFYPDNGGFQYGPRYWYIGHAPMPLTIAAGLPLANNAWPFWRWRLDPLRLAGAQFASFVGFTLGYGVFLHLQAEVRMTPLRVAALAQAPAMVLVADQQQRYVRWEKDANWLLSKDYTRNGIGGDLGPVAIGRNLGEERTALLCRQLPDRAIYKLHMDPWAPRAWLDPVCNADRPPLGGPG